MSDIKSAPAAPNREVSAVLKVATSLSFAILACLVLKANWFLLKYILTGRVLLFPFIEVKLFATLLACCFSVLWIIKEKNILCVLTAIFLAARTATNALSYVISFFNYMSEGWVVTDLGEEGFLYLLLPACWLILSVLLVIGKKEWALYWMYILAGLTLMTALICLSPYYRHEEFVLAFGVLLLSAIFKRRAIISKNEGMDKSSVGQAENSHASQECGREEKVYNEQFKARPTMQKTNIGTGNVSSATQELTAQERALIASLVTHNPVLGYAVGHYNDNAEEDSVTCFYTGDVNQTKSFMNIPTYNPTQYSWDTRHKYKCGLVSFHAHSGIPCTETRIGRERMSGYVERSTATYNYENVPYSAYATYIKYILSRGITYMNKDNDYDIETYDFYFCVNGQNGSLTLSYSDGTVDVMHIFS